MPHHSCVIQLPLRTFIPVGIYSYVGDEFNLWGNGKDKGWHLCGAAVTWGHSMGRQWVKILLLEVTRQREETKDTQWTWPENRDKHRGVRDAGDRGSRQRNSGKETRPEMSVPFSAARFNLLNTTPGQNNVRFVSNFITNQNLILAWRRRDERRDRF